MATQWTGNRPTSWFDSRLGLQRDYDVKFTRIMQVAGWLLLAGAVFLTLSPRRFRPVTGFEHHVEHLAAFALLGFVFGLGYPRRRLVLALAGIAAVALLELAQHWVPGRHGTWSDFVVNAVSIALGFAAAAVIDWLRRPRGA
jgi:VanZ family protein